MDINPTSATLSFSAHASALKFRAFDVGNWIVMISRVYSLAIATDNNIVYLDLNSGVVKRCHHAQFDEAWYLQSSRPPAAQLLYNIGIAPDPASYSEVGVITPPIVSDYHPPGSVDKITVPWPPLHSPSIPQSVPDMCTRLPLPLGHMASSITPRLIPARAAKASALESNTPRLARRPKAIDIMADFDISKKDMAMIYLSPDPYYEAFAQPVDLRNFDPATHATAVSACLSPVAVFTLPICRQVPLLQRLKTGGLV